MNFARGLLFTSILLLGACATPRQAEVHCGRESELDERIESAQSVRELTAIEALLTDKSDIYLHYLLNKKMSALEARSELRKASAEYAEEILVKYPEILECEKSL